MSTFALVLVVIAAIVWFALAMLIGYRLGWENGRKRLSADFLRANPRPPRMDLGNTVARNPRRG